MKTLLAAAGFALFAAGSGFGPVGASSSGTYYYTYVYFSDSSQTTIVGYNNQSCNPWTGQVSDNITGTQTQFYNLSILGYCSAGGDQPL
jgi:hypothetical protein